MYLRFASLYTGSIRRSLVLSEKRSQDEHAKLVDLQEAVVLEDMDVASAVGNLLHLLPLEPLVDQMMKAEVEMELASPFSADKRRADKRLSGSQESGSRGSGLLASGQMESGRLVRSR